MLKTVKVISLSDSTQSTPQGLYTKWIKTHAQKWIKWNMELWTICGYAHKEVFLSYIWPKCLTSNGNSDESGWSPLTRATNLSTQSTLKNLSFHVTEFIVMFRLVWNVELFSLIFSDKHGLPRDSITCIVIKNRRKADISESKGQESKQVCYHLRYVGDGAACVKWEIWSGRIICWQRTQLPEVFIAYEKMSTRHK